MDFNDWFVYDESSPSCLKWKVDIYSGEYYNVRRVAAGDNVGTKAKNVARYYSISRYGDSDAFQMAVFKRELEICKLNAMGAGYTETHGK